MCNYVQPLKQGGPSFRNGHTAMTYEPFFIFFLSM